jgi:hypothetical protein
VCAAVEALQSEPIRQFTQKKKKKKKKERKETMTGAQTGPQQLMPEYRADAL